MEKKHERILSQGVSAWNQWRIENPQIRPDLSGIKSYDVIPPSRLGIDLSGVNFQGVILEDADFYRSWLVDADFSGAELANAIFGEATLGGAKFIGAQLQGANFMKANLFEADFTDATLTGTKFYGAFLEKAILKVPSLLGQWFEAANLKGADLSTTDLSGGNFKDANLKGADLSNTDLSGANLKDANLQAADLRYTKLCNADLRSALLVETQVEGADFDGALVYGISVWGIKGTPKKQTRLVISSEYEPTVTVDDLDVAQFIYLLCLKREKLKNVIDSMTGKAVLLLGRFTPERIAILEAIAQKLREFGEVPLIFNFDKPEALTISETVRILASLSKFIIGDLTDPKSIPYESHLIVPDIHVPFFPIIQEGYEEFSMFDDLYEYDWLLEGFAYSNTQHLVDNIEKIREEALAKRVEISEKRRDRKKREFRTDLGRSNSS